MEVKQSTILKRCQLGFSWCVFVTPDTKKWHPVGNLQQSFIKGHERIRLLSEKSKKKKQKKKNTELKA